MIHKYKLSWQNFSEHLGLMFRALHEEQRHADVTLICDDKTQFRAHKIVLSACSPVFKEIIDSNPSQHPLIYLRGIQSSEMESILQFMYLGEGRFHHERMGEFLKVAKDLKVKEIYRNLEEETNSDTPDEIGETVNVREILTEGIEKKNTDLIINGGIAHKVKEDTELFSEEDTSKNDDKKRKIENEKNQSRIIPEYLCQECGLVYSCGANLSRHVKSNHRGVKFYCDKCEFQTTDQSNLKKHIKGKHDGVRYPCSKCDYKASIKNHLKLHVQSVHDGVKYPCPHCDRKISKKSKLLVHIRNIHEGVKYPCSDCDYQATQKSNLGLHIRTKHKKS